jgi:hypothetical protein
MHIENNTLPLQSCDAVRAAPITQQGLATAVSKYQDTVTKTPTSTGQMEADMALH